VTVCVAVLHSVGASRGGAYLVSDRMLTAGDVQFEPPQSKVIWLSTAIAMMVAGDVGFHVRVAYDVMDAVNARIREDPGNWWRVRDVADLYSECFSRIRLKAAETKVLRPLGLDAESFIARQSELAPTFVREISNEMLGFHVPESHVLFVGADETGPHIYKARDEVISCHDPAGFAAIGAGAWHAESYLMLQRHTRTTPAPAAMVSGYFAKRRAEIAPGVGTETDMWFVGPALGASGPLPDIAMDQLARAYRRERDATLRADNRARKEVESFIVETLRQRQAAQESSPPTPTGPPGPESPQPAASDPPPPLASSGSPDSPSGPGQS